MDTPAQPAAQLGRRFDDSLAEEIRHSAFLLGGALGLMGLFAAVLLVLTTRFGG
jgi:hypothetical protein